MDDVGRSPALRGVIPVLETPFDAAGDLDVDSFTRLAEHVCAAGVDGVMFPGFASEFAKLADDERVILEDRLIEVTRRHPDVTAVVSIPDHATRLALARAERAVTAGADALNVLPPSFLSPSRDSILEHLRAILLAVPHTPVMVQLAPALTGGALSAFDLAGLAGEHQNLVSIKVETMPPGRTVEAITALAPALTCLAGYAGIHLPDALARGAHGVQPGSSAVELYVTLWGHWTAGRHDEFHALHVRLLPYLSLWMTGVEYIVQVEKTISARRGLIDSDICRQPGYRLDRHDHRVIDEFLAEFADDWEA